jgi:DNA-binding CsgD family transcriptional regulator
MTTGADRAAVAGSWPCLHLTPRETAILCLIADGYTTAHAAQQLHISRHTVAQHIGDMLRRAHARNRCELIARAYTTGTLAVDFWPPRPPGI